MPTKNNKQKDDNAQAIQKGGGSLSDTLRTINSGGGAKGLQTVLPNAPASGGGSQLQTAVPNRPGTASSQVPAWLQTAVPTQANMQSSTALGDGGTFSDSIRTDNPGTLYNPPPGVVNIDPSQMVNPYTGVPVNNSYSDTLRSIKPTQRGNTLTFSDMLRDVMAGNYKSTKDVPFAPKNAAGGNGDGGGYPGFGSRYGGNWGGGGGGWDGGGGGGYDNTSAWMRYLLNLYSWNIK